MIDYFQKNWLEWFGVITGLLYLFLEIRQHSAMWVIGFITSLVYVFVFFESKFYADMGLNIYYVLMSVYGFWLWRFVDKNAPTVEEEQPGEISFQNLTIRLALKLSVIALALYFSMAFVLMRFTDSPIPYGDALSTALSIVATWMLAKKIIQHWFVWIFVNVFSIFLFAYRGLYPTSMLFFFYGVLSFVGYYKWKMIGVKAVNELNNPKSF